MKKLRWGILSTAKILNRLMPAFHAAETVELVGIAGRSLDRTTETARKFGIPRVYGSYDELLADPAIDAVYNPLPNSLHDEWTRRAADAGKHILCEKPLTPTADEAAALTAYVRRKGVCLMDGFMWPHHPRTTQLKEMIRSGVIGELRRVNATFSFLLELDPANIRLQPDLGGGALLDVGCYPVYGIRWAFGCEPIRVSAVATYLHGVDVELAATLYFADGRTATFDTSFLSPLRQWFEVVGTKGTLFVPEMWVPGPQATAILTGEQRDRPREEITVSGEEQMVHMLNNFAAAVFAEREAIPSPDEAVKSLRVLDAIQASARRGGALVEVAAA